MIKYEKPNAILISKYIDWDSLMFASQYNIRTPAEIKDIPKDKLIPIFETLDGVNFIKILYNFETDISDQWLGTKDGKEFLKAHRRLYKLKIKCDAQPDPKLMDSYERLLYGEATYIGRDGYDFTADCYDTDFWLLSLISLTPYINHYLDTYRIIGNKNREALCNFILNKRCKEFADFSYLYAMM